MEADALEPREVPSLYFVGVSTDGSFIQDLFPVWSDMLDLGAELVGFDAPLDASPEVYRRVVRHLRDDPLAEGALVTSHKLDLLEAARDLIDDLDRNARLLHEVSCLSVEDGRLHGRALDPITAGMALRAWLPDDHFRSSGAEVLCLGAGGAGAAIAVHLCTGRPDGDHPAKFTAVDVRERRLDHLRDIRAELDTDVIFRYELNEDPARNDELVAALPAGSLVINATGMGKDRPGSPLTDEVEFPRDGYAWELNYRGERRFMTQAERGAAGRNVHVEDGWRYFLHGWSEVIAEVFDVHIDDTTFTELADAADEVWKEKRG